MAHSYPPVEDTRDGWKYLADRRGDLIEAQAEEIASLKQQLNKALQARDKWRRRCSELGE